MHAPPSLDDEDPPHGIGRGVPLPRTKLAPWEDLLCGALAGSTARMCVAPLDVIKIRFQVQQETGGLYAYRSMRHAASEILTKEGVLAFWKGNVPALLMVAPYASMQFALFYQMRRSQLLRALPSSTRDLLFGGLAGAVATLGTYPLDLVRTRLAAEPARFRGMADVAREVWRSHGPVGLYLGVSPTLVEIVPYIALQYATYEQGRALLTRARRTDELRWIESLALGASTGTFAKFVTLPLDNAKKRMQVEGQFHGSRGGGAAYSGPIDALLKIYRHEGLRGWFRGTAPSLVKAAPNSAITFAAYEACKRFWLRNRYGAEPD